MKRIPKAACAATVVLLSISLCAPLPAVSMGFSAAPGVQAHGDFLTIAAKKKKPVRRNPKNGDVLIGPVEGFRQPDWKKARMGREGNDLGGLIGKAVNNFMRGGIPSGSGGSRGRRAGGADEAPMGAQGQTCGVQYWTDTPTAPDC